MWRFVADWDDDAQQRCVHHSTVTPPHRS
jgi:hypothetical protein